MKINLPLSLLAIVLTWFYSEVKSQDLWIKKANTPITIDGIMDEGAWEEADVADRFMQNFPYDSSEAVAPTEVRMTYDENFVYLIAVMQNLGPRKYVVPSLRRDYRGEAYDGFTLILDTYKDKTNAFVFGINPYVSRVSSWMEEMRDAVVVAIVVYFHLPGIISGMLKLRSMTIIG